MPSPVDDDIELAAAIGRCSNDWSHAEVQLALLFCVLTQMEMTMGVAIFGCFRSVKAHREAILRAAKVSRLVNDERISELTGLLNTYEKLSLDRNKIAHNPIGISPEERDLYIMLKKTKMVAGELPYETHPISVDGINGLSSSIKDLVREIMVITRAISGMRLGAAQ